MTCEAQTVEANYARSYGQHDFVATSGEVVSVVSEPTWESFYRRLESSERLGDFVLSPERITFPIGLNDIPASQADIERRIADVQELSLERPDTTIVLGTPTFNNPTGRPANSLIFITAGEVAAQTNKGFSTYPAEERVFTLRQATASRTTAQAFAGMVCSDILDERTGNGYEVGGEQDSVQKITADTRTVLLSACWAIPLVGIPEAVMPSGNHESRFRRQLEGRIALLFSRNPGVREVIIADRLPPGSKLDAPYNGHFTRVAESGSTLADAAVA
jgi:hypothetical protein